MIYVPILFQSSLELETQIFVDVLGSGGGVSEGQAVPTTKNLQIREFSTATTGAVRPYGLLRRGKSPSTGDNGAHTAPMIALGGYHQWATPAITAMFSVTF